MACIFVVSDDMPNKIYDVFVVQHRNGEWFPYAYRVEDRERVKDPPKRLQKRFLGRVSGCRSGRDAIQAAIEHDSKRQ